MLIDDENQVELHIACNLIRNIFNDIFDILKRQEKKIDDLEQQVSNMKITKAELLLGSLAQQLIIKMFRFTNNTDEDPSLTACRTTSMIRTLTDFDKLKQFINNNGYNLEDIFLSIHVLKTGRLTAAHLSDPATTSSDIQRAIDHVYPSSHPKRQVALEALEVLQILSQTLHEPLFLHIKY